MIHNCVDTTILMSLRQLARDYLGIAVAQESSSDPTTAPAARARNSSTSYTESIHLDSQHEDNRARPPVVAPDIESDAVMTEPVVVSTDNSHPSHLIETSAILKSVSKFDEKSAPSANVTTDLVSDFDDTFNATFPKGRVVEIFNILAEAVSPDETTKDGPGKSQTKWSLEKMVAEAWVCPLPITLWTP